MKSLLVPRPQNFADYDRLCRLENAGQPPEDFRFESFCIYLDESRLRHTAQDQGLLCFKNQGRSGYISGVVRRRNQCGTKIGRIGQPKWCYFRLGIIYKRPETPLTNVGTI